MGLGLGIFASVVLILLVYHKGFRKFMLWASAVAAGLALLAALCYYGYDRYSTLRAERETKKQNVATAKGIQACMLRLGTPMAQLDIAVAESGGKFVGFAPGKIPSEKDKQYSDNLTACRACPDAGRFWAGGIDLSAGIVAPTPLGDCTPPAGYTLDSNGKIVPAPITLDFSKAQPIFPAPKPKEEHGPWEKYGAAPKHTRLEATATCDTSVFDREEYAANDREAIGLLHKGDAVPYIGHVTISGEQIIRFHGRRGYVAAYCLNVEEK